MKKPELTKSGKLKKSEVRRRKNSQSFRMDDEERAAFIAAYEAANLSAADFIRLKCCSAKPLRTRRRNHLHRVDEKKLAQALGLLGKSGSNNNQIAHALNIAMKEPDFNAPYAVQILKKYDKDIAAIQAEISECRTILREILLAGDFRG